LFGEFRGLIVITADFFRLVRIGAEGQGHTGLAVDRQIAQRGIHFTDRLASARGIDLNGYAGFLERFGGLFDIPGDIRGRPVAEFFDEVRMRDDVKEPRSK